MIAPTHSNVALAGLLNGHSVLVTGPGQGNVVNIGSISASRACAGGMSYSTIKVAAEMLNKVMALELAVKGIRVNAVAPGVMETPMTRASRNNPARRDYLMQRIPIKRFVRPDEFVGPVSFLAL